MESFPPEIKAANFIIINYNKSNQNILGKICGY